MKNDYIVTKPLFDWLNENGTFTVEGVTAISSDPLLAINPISSTIVEICSSLNVSLDLHPTRFHHHLLAQCRLGHHWISLASNRSVTDRFSLVHCHLAFFLLGVTDGRLAFLDVKPISFYRFPTVQSQALTPVFALLCFISSVVHFLFFFKPYCLKVFCLDLLTSTAVYLYASPFTTSPFCQFSC